MKTAKRLKFRAKVQLKDIHPDIHPDDAMTALKTWFWRSYKQRKKPPHLILEKLLIASAMNETKDNNVLPPVWRDRAGKIVPGIVRGFETRWKRAQKDGRVTVWDKIDIFILKNWRVIRLLPLERCPGLIEWSPTAATALIRGLPIGADARDEKWFVKKRNRLGLKGQRRYRVREFKIFRDGTFSVSVET